MNIHQKLPDKKKERGAYLCSSSEPKDAIKTEDKEREKEK